MIYNDKKFDLMLESAWRAFESTLMLHGMTRYEIELVNKRVPFYDAKFITEYEVSRVVEWEDE